MSGFELKNNMLLGVASAATQVDGGELDHSCAGEIREKIDKEINLHGINNLVIDFCNVPFMDSSGIGMLLGRYKLIKARGGKMLVIRTCPQVDKIIELSGLKKLMCIE